MALIDELFFEITVKAGAGTDAEIGKFAGSLKKVGTAADKADDELEGLDETTDRLGDSTKQTTGIFGRLFARLRGGAQGITALSTSFLAIRQVIGDVVRGVTRAVGAFVNLVQRGGEVINVGRAFARVVPNQTIALNKLREATQGLISDFDLQVGFNRAVALGSAETADEFAELAKAGLTLGRALGVDAAFAVESLNLGIGRQSRLILDNLGLIISVEEANQAFADSVGRSVEQLTLEEKRLAFRNAALTAATDKIEELGGVQLNAADNLVRFQVAFANLRDEIGVFLADSENVGAAFDFLTKALTGSFNAAKAFIGGIALIGTELAVLEGQLTLLGERIGLVFTQIFGGVIQRFEGAIRSINERLQSLAGSRFGRINIPLQLAAKATGALVANLDDAAESGETLEEQARSRVADAEAELGFLKEARDIEQQRIVLGEDLANAERDLRNERAMTARFTLQQLEEQETLLKSLADDVAAATQLAAQQTLNALDETEAELRKAFADELPAAAAEGLARLREIAQEALSRELAEEIGKEFADGLAAGLETIEIETLDIESPEERTAEVLERQRALFEETIALARERIRLGGLSEAQERAVLKVISSTRKELDNLNKGRLKDIKKAADDEKKAARDRFKSLQTTVSLIGQAAAGAADLAAEFGIVNEKTQETIKGAIQLGSALATAVNAVGALQAGVGGIGAAISAALGIAGAISGLLGGGPSPEAQALAETLEENSDRLLELTGAVNELRGSFDITGADLAQALRDISVGERRDIIQQIADLVASLFATGGIQEDIGQQIIEQFEQTLRDLGVDIANLDAVAEELGITIRDEAGNIIPQAIVQLIEALEAVEDQLVGFADTIQGAFSRLRAEIEIFDIEDPIDQFRLLQERLLDIQNLDPAEVFAILNDQSLTFLQRLAKLAEALRAAGENVTPFLQELLGIDVTTAEGRADADALIRRLFTQLAEGIITPEELGAATFDEAIQILLEMEGLLDEINQQEEDAAGEEEGQTQDIRRSVQITELQGNQLLAFLSTLAVRAEQRNALLEAILSVLGGAAGEVPFGPPPPPPPMDGLEDVVEVFRNGPEEIAPMIGTVNIDAEINVGDGATREQAEEAREIFLDDIETELGDRLINAQRQVGLPRIQRERLQR